MTFCAKATLVLALLLSACAPAPADSENSNGIYSAQLTSAPDFSDVHSRFITRKLDFAGAMTLDGSFADGPPPAFRTQAEVQGNCRLMTYEPSICAPACSGSDICINEECRTFPERFTEGTLKWEWSDGSIDVEASGTQAYFASVELSDTLNSSLTFNGQTLEVPFDEAPIPESDWEELFLNRQGEDVELRWTNPIDDARVRLTMTDCAGSHGGIGAFEIECEAPDTGSLTINAEFIDALDEGFWGRGNCGGHMLERYHADSLSLGDGSTRFESVADTIFNYRP